MRKIIYKLSMLSGIVMTALSLLSCGEKSSIPTSENVFADILKKVTMVN